jgi:hypothetical protein
MAIPAEFEKYPDEEAFRNNLLIPLLHRLGYSVVVNNHGTREFGRDIIFGEIDKFGHFYFHGLQAKFEGSIGLGKKIEALISDVSQAFNTPFTHPHTGEQQRISRFYVANAGSISDQAKEAFFAGLHQPSARANSRLLDGKGIIALDRWAAYNRGEFIKEQLTALLFELRYNKNVLNVLMPNMQQYVNSPDDGTFQLVRCRLHAVSALLQKPILADISLLLDLETYWQFVRSINDTADSIGVPVTSKGFMKGRLEGLVRFSGQIISLGDIMYVKVMNLLKQLEPSLPL